MPSKRKKMRQEKPKKREEEKGEKYLETLLSARAWTLQAKILHLQSEGREVNDLQTAGQWPGNRSTSFETIQLLFLLINNSGQNIKLGKVVGFAIGHFTVTGGNEARVDLVFIQPFPLSYANHAALMLSSIFKHNFQDQCKGYISFSEIGKGMHKD